MTQFNFTTNIEHRMPDTGKVYCIDRMTSDYAEAHPFDVDAFIESVYQKYVQMAEEDAFCKAWVKTREELRSLWTAVLSVKSPRGDASLYPNKYGPQPALMEVWHKAGDYWRCGLRQGDTLPDIVPMAKITRLDDGGWIALFPKDAHLLENGESDEPVVIAETRNDEIAPELEPKQEEPRQLDLFAFEQPKRKRRPTANRQRKPRKPVVEHQPSDISHQTSDSDHAWLRSAGYLAAASVALLVIWQTGLIIPLGLIGLATSGLLK